MVIIRLALGDWDSRSRDPRDSRDSHCRIVSRMRLFRHCMEMCCMGWANSITHMSVAQLAQYWWQGGVIVLITWQARIQCSVKNSAQSRDYGPFSRRVKTPPPAVRLINSVHLILSRNGELDELLNRGLVGIWVLPLKPARSGLSFGTTFVGVLRSGCCCGVLKEPYRLLTTSVWPLQYTQLRYSRLSI